MPMPMPQGAPVPPQLPPGPQGSPMTQPSPNEGKRQMGMVKVEGAMQMLEQAIPDLGSNTPEGAAVTRALSALSSKFNRAKSEGLVPAQILELAKAQQPSPIAGMLGGAGGPQPAGAPAPGM
jgi:hypothetical protein